MNVYNILVGYVDGPGAGGVGLDYGGADDENSMYILNKYGSERKDTYVNISNMPINSNYLKNIENILDGNEDFCIFNNTTLKFFLLSNHKDIVMLLLLYNRIDISNINQEELFDDII
jgi:hypothetical protein